MAGCERTAEGKIRTLAQAVLDARAKYPDETLADFYDVTTMPADLRKVHKKLDEAMDGFYKRGGFDSDRERVEHLFAVYKKLATPLTAASGKAGRKKVGQNGALRPAQL